MSSALDEEGEGSSVALTVLVVDDAAINRKLLRKMLSSDYLIEEASDGKEALEMVLRAPAKYSIVLMDLMMPVMDGHESVARIRQAGIAHLPIIAVTANANEDPNTCLERGFSAFLSKPCRKEVLRAKIKELIQIASAK